MQWIPFVTRRRQTVLDILKIVHTNKRQVPINIAKAQRNTKATSNTSDKCNYLILECADVPKLIQNKKGIKHNLN